MNEKTKKNTVNNKNKIKPMSGMLFHSASPRCLVQSGCGELLLFYVYCMTSFPVTVQNQKITTKQKKCKNT